MRAKSHEQMGYWSSTLLLSFRKKKRIVDFMSQGAQQGWFIGFLFLDIIDVGRLLDYCLCRVM